MLAPLMRKHVESGHGCFYNQLPTVVTDSLPRFNDLTLDHRRTILVVNSSPLG
jgi:hypothetical protein